MTVGTIFDIKEFSLNDGPGIRTTIFFKGCPLRCSWCHNPEGMQKQIQLKESGPACIDCGKCRVPCEHAECKPFGRCLHVCPLGRLRSCGRKVDAESLAHQIKRQADFLTKNDGGITFSGGEPMSQPKFLLALASELRPLHLAIETSGYAPPKVFDQVTSSVDLVMIDIKHMDSAMHRRYTGVRNELILTNINRLILMDKPFIARIPLIPGVNDNEANIEATAIFLQGAESLQRVELMPYNPLAGAKYRGVGIEFLPGFIESTTPNITREPFLSRGINCTVL